jgi:hypothetical protein
MAWGILNTLGTYKIGPRLWILSQSFNIVTPRGIVSVPRGFVTDHASVPRPFWSLIPPVADEIAEASIPHDYFYVKESEEVPRKFADECLYEIARVNGASWVTAQAAHKAVRVASWGMYRKKYSWDKIPDGAYARFKTLTPGEILQAIEENK